MMQMTQEKFEEKLGFEFKTMFSHLPSKMGIAAERGKTTDDTKTDHDADKQQTYELRVRI